MLLGHVCFQIVYLGEYKVTLVTLVSDAVTRCSGIMSGRSTTLISYDPPAMSNAASNISYESAMSSAGSDNTDGDNGQLAKLQEKVKICLGAILVCYF